MIPTMASARAPMALKPFSISAPKPSITGTFQSGAQYLMIRSMTPNTAKIAMIHNTTLLIAAICYTPSLIVEYSID